MSLDKATVPQVLYDPRDPHTQPSELYKINAVVLDAATDPVKCWVVTEEHGYWDEANRKFLFRTPTLMPTDPKHCVSLKDAFVGIERQKMLRVREGFKYQMEWDPCEPPFFFCRFEIQPDGTRKQY
jgi:hypothetical protein